MALDDVRPFAKVAAVVLGVAALAVGLKLCSGKDSPAASCESLPMDAINPCQTRVKKECSGPPEAVRACVEKILTESKRP